jgi:SAM-dependent methyltransferase
MATAHVQGSLWGLRARDYAAHMEPFARPMYEAVFAAAAVSAGTDLLDVGCGPGLAAHLAAGRGAHVAGLDAAVESIGIARERTPGGDFRVGDLENLPWPDNTFDVVTGFNAFQYATDVVNALAEARRVARPGGRVAMAVLGRPEECAIAVVLGALGPFLPPPPPGMPGPFALSAPGRLDALLEQAGLTPLSGAEADGPIDFPDLATALRGLLSAGPAAAAIRQAGRAAVEAAVAAALTPFRTAADGYHLRNRYRYAIAAV